MSALELRRRAVTPLVFAAVAGVALLAARCGKQEPAAADHTQHDSATAAAPGHAGHVGAPEATDAGSPHGYVPVRVDPSRVAPMAVSTAAVEEGEVTRRVRTVGLVVLDETRTAHVHPKVRGWIESISVNFVGQRVEAGDVLCTIYSQEVYAAESELLAVLGQGGPLLQAARRRLALWDVPKSEIARLERTGEARRTFPLLAPRAGTVVAKQALQGMYVDASLELYTLSDLAKLWVLADVYDADVPFVTEGARARLRIQGLPEPIETTVAFLYPTLDEATRTRKARFELADEKAGLLPGAFVDVELELAIGRGLTVPESAVIRTGTRSIVFVAHGEPATHFEPREVRLGALAGDRYVVEAGLAAGDRVATGAQFLLDSESRVSASSSKGGGHAGH